MFFLKPTEAWRRMHFCSQEGRFESFTAKEGASRDLGGTFVGCVDDNDP